MPPRWRTAFGGGSKYVDSLPHAFLTIALYGGEWLASCASRFIPDLKGPRKPLDQRWDRRRRVDLYTVNRMSASAGNRTPIIPLTIIQLSYKISNVPFATCGPGKRRQYSDSIRAGRSRDRIPVKAKFFAPVQTGPEPTQPPIKREPGLFPGGKAAGAWS